MSEGLLRQPELDPLVLCEYDGPARVNQFLKTLGRAWLKYLQIRAWVYENEFVGPLRGVWQFLKLFCDLIF